MEEGGRGRDRDELGRKRIIRKKSVKKRRRRSRRMNVWTRLGNSIVDTSIRLGPEANDWAGNLAVRKDKIVIWILQYST